MLILNLRAAENSVSQGSPPNPWEHQGSPGWTWWELSWFAWEHRGAAWQSKKWQKLFFYLLVLNSEASLVMWGGQSNTAQGRTVFPQGSHNTHKGIFSRGVPLDLWSGCLRFAWEAVVSCVAEEHCAGAGPSLLWGGRKGEQFFFFFYTFLN